MTDEHVPPNFLNPELIQAFLRASRCSDTPESQPQMLFPATLPGNETYSVFVESTSDGDWWRVPTYEEREAKRDAERDAEKERERVLIAEHAELMATATGLRRAVLELHAPDEYGLCQGCVTDCCAPKVSDCPSYALARDWPETP